MRNDAPKEIREIIKNEGYIGVNPVLFGYQDCENSHHFGPAVREYWLLHYVVSGSGFYTIGEKTHPVKAGQIFVIPPNVQTYYEADAQTPWSYIWVGFTCSEELHGILNAPVIRAQGAGRIFFEMKRCAELENGRSAFLCGKIWELFSLLLEEKKPEKSHIDKALSIMNAEYVTGITVTSVAERLNLDRTYFSALFSRSVGTSAVQYLSELKLNRAAELMAKGALKPQAAAMAVGYSDYCHFSKAFKKHFGVSPRKYVENRENANNDSHSFSP